MSETPPLTGRVALVTGAGRGLGRAYAITLARLGARVAVNSRSADSVAAVVDAIAQQGGEARACPGDLSEPGVPAAVVAAAVAGFGRLDVVVNNAGGSEVPSVPFAATETVHRDAMMQQNFATAWDVTAAAWPYLEAGGYGRVVLFASPLAFYGQPGLVGYAAAKGALVGLARTLAAEGAEHGITVNVVNPVADTGQSPDAFSRWPRSRFSVGHVAASLAWLVDERCTVNGEIFSIAGSRVARVSVTENTGYVGAAELEDPEMLGRHFGEVQGDGAEHRFFTMADLVGYLDELYGPASEPPASR